MTFDTDWTREWAKVNGARSVLFTLLDEPTGDEIAIADVLCRVEECTHVLLGLQPNDR